MQVRRGGHLLPVRHMGPCRITAKAPHGVCGADADTIAARNLLREIADGERGSRKAALVGVCR